MPKTFDDEFVSSLDQPIRMDAANMIKNVDDFYDKAVTNQDLDEVLKVITGLISGFRLSGLALSKLFYRLKQDWSKFNSSDTFEDVIFDVTGISKVTVNRYIGVWRLFEENLVPDSLTKKLQARPIRSLIPMAKAVEQGYEINDEEWQRLADAPDDATVRNELHQIKGEAVRRNGLLIRLKRSGDLVVYGNDDIATVGFLNTGDSNPSVKRAIERIISSAGIVEE
jgi:hypothetical protein